MKKIIYFGIIQFKYQNAMCQRAEGIKKMAEQIGYEFIEIGVDADVNDSYLKLNKNTFAIREPRTTKDWIKSCFSIDDLVDIIEQYDLNEIEAFIMADYRYIPMLKMKKYCEKHNIKFVADIMDWFSVEWTVNGIIKKIDNELRMHCLYPFLDRRIYICSQYERKWKNRGNSRVIPGVVIEKSNIEYCNNNRIRIAFAGRPEKKCKKEKINWILKAIKEGENKDKFELHIAGLTKNQFINENPTYGQYIDDNVRFYGRISHNQCIDIIKRSDFTVVVRPNTKLSNYGFSTKIGESFTYNVPVLATDTSDNSIYINNHVNGFICSCDYSSVEAMITEIGKLSKIEINEMKKNIYEENPLFYDQYLKRFQEVICD